jgi:hypothetical protein
MMSEANHYDDGYWAVDYDAKNRVFTVRTLDVHTVPLKLPLSEMVRIAGGAVRDKDAQTDQAPLVGVSRKDKSLYIAVPEGWAGILKLPRKELYQLGKRMGRRGKKRK